MGKGGLSPDRPRGTTTDPARGPAAPLRAGATPGPSSSDPSPARDPAPFLAGVWVGASWPSPELIAVDPTVPTNPIRWSLALEQSGGDASAAEPATSPITAFGAGFFDDSADVPGHTHLWFTLRGHFDARTREVRLDKVYERPAPEGEAVRYAGKLHALNGAPEITGTWENATHGTNGTFSCMLRTGEGAQDGDAIARTLGGR